ncbi:hemin ABC transporter substrate-binding protein [Afifella sp. IM 167]|uniref:heme/hemin ABC transporter substrate-binding protein n=1 Tax=Afifella sp. IM 167 TaxID=2033586 RepID=UPI001CCE301C|nr:ABC transporter substrate-binding protein [Afifella sp. IM 167]MBZ8134772.1 hemin ABC transporter substrate-binding protein [Afifella sp. IM 167]
MAFLVAAILAPGTTSAAERLPDEGKLVAIGGSVTEIVYALGEEDRLVARDTTSTWPEAAKALPDIGYMRQLSPEGVLSVGPDGILSIEGSGPPETMAVLESSGVPLVTIPEGYSAEGVVRKIEKVGEALGAQERAAKLAGSVKAEMERLARTVSGVNDRKRVLFILSVQGGKVLAAGTDTAADAIIRLAGGVNAVTGYSGYKALTDEALIEAAPDAILMMDRGEADGHAAAGILQSPALKATPAGEAGNLIRMDGLYLLGFGPRTPDAARELFAALYGESALH